jgi:uncharacterized protein YjlB
MSAGRLLARMAAEGLIAHGWSNGPNERYGRHAHDYDKVIVVAEGSIDFGLVATGQRIELLPGDRLELPAGTAHDARVGPAGVTCLEAHRPAGTLPAGPRRRAAEDW